MMSVKWINTENLSFNTVLLLERVQLSWFPGWVPEDELAIALAANPAVDWYLRHKCPELTSWLDHARTSLAGQASPTPERIRQAEVKVLDTINDLLVYVVDPTIYDAQPFLGWASDELRRLADFSDKVVLDIGSGTGRLAFVAAENARVVFAVEPVGNLRRYIRQKAAEMALDNVFAADGLITAIPFPDGFADITMAGHVFGDHPQAEYAEMRRVTKPGGMIILCPGSSLGETTAHEYLLSQGFNCAQYDEPVDGTKRKYWKRVE